MNETLTKLTELLKVQVSSAAKTLALMDNKLSAVETVRTIPPFGKQIKALRKRRNITQLDLCSALDISQYALSGYERDIIRPDIETVLKMANYFGVTVDYLLKGERNER